MGLPFFFILYMEIRKATCRIIIPERNFNPSRRLSDMSEFMEIVKGRRSIRKYQDKEVPGEILNQVLEAVQWSPSWANSQCWEIIAVKDLAVKEKLKETLAPKNPATYAVADAPIVLAVCGKLNSSGFYKDQVTTKFGDWFMFDLGIATQSICLTAHQLGLGTVVVGLFDHNKAKEVLGVPQGYELVVLIPLGYPAKESPTPKRREISEFTHHNVF
jgi:nitroreductase